jgi:putative intracellular protease/amidase
MVKVLFVNTAAPALKGGPTGVWLEEIATPYYAMKEAGFEVAMANMTGGPSPIDQGSMGENFFTDACKKFLHDAVAMGMFGHQLKLGDIDSADYDAIYLTGGHGTCVDFVGNPVLKKLIETTYAAGKIVAADCHGPIGLAEACKPDGSPLVKGLKVTGFSDSEEAAVNLTDTVPFLIEQKFKDLGAEYTKGDDWNPHAVVDGKLVTGQNPQSSDACAAEVIKLLKA